MTFSKGKHAGAAVLAAVVFFAGAVAADAQTKLGYKFKEGEKLNYALDQKMEMKMNVGGMDINMEMNQNIGWVWEVQEVKGGKAKIRQKFDRIKFVMDTPMGKVEYDSKANKEPQGQLGMVLAPMFKALAGMEFNVVMDQQGNVTEFKIPEKHLQALKEAAPGGAPGLDMFSEEGLKRMTSNAGLTFPKEAVEKGKTWDQKADMKMPFGTMVVAQKFTYQGPESKDGKTLEKIGLKANVTLEPDPNAQVAMKLKDQGAQGTAYFDNQAGRLRNLQMNQNMQMEINAGGQNLTQNIRQTVTLRLVEGKEE